MENKKWKFRDDMLGYYINSGSNRTFQDAEDRLNYLESKLHLLDINEENINEYIEILEDMLDRIELRTRFDEYNPELAALRFAINVLQNRH